MGRGMRVEGSMNYVLDVGAAEGEFGVENWINYVLEKLREIGRAMSPEEWINFVREKLKEFLAVLEHFGKIFMEQLIHWARVAAPYIVVALALWIFLRYFRGCCCLVGRGVRSVGRGVGSGVSSLVGRGVGSVGRGVGVGSGVSSLVGRGVGSVGRGVGSGVKTMIAPGTGGAVRILRAPFEANPASYFRGLRAK